MANTYGGATDVLGLANDSFEFVSAPVSGSKDSAVAKKSDGEFIPATHTSFNERRECVFNYVAKVLTSLTFPTVLIGVDVEDWHITGVRVGSTGTGHVTLAVTAHLHEGGESGAAHTDNSKTVVFPTANGYGAFDPFGTSGLTAAEIQSSFWEATIGHRDETSSTGKWLVGRSQGLKVTAGLEAVSDQAITLADPSGWKLTAKSTPRNEEGFYGLSISGEFYPGDTWDTED